MTAMPLAPALSSTLPAQPVPTQSVTCRPAVVVVAVQGALDLGTVPRMRELLRDALNERPGRLVVDMVDCPFLDACALTMLLDVHRRCWRAGSVLTLRGCSPRVLRLLSLTGLRRVFDLAD